MPKNVLITGGTGVVGRALTPILQEQGFQVSYLTRDTTQKSPKGVRLFAWDITKGEIEPAAIQEADAIIHLAGAGIADERWTEDRKKVILNSRTETASLLRTYLEKVPNQVKAFISASGITRYGLDTGERWLHEDTPVGDDFVADVVVKWEEEADKVADLGLRTVKLRLGVVLSETGGALAKLTTPVKLWVGSPLGEGKQYVSWVHIKDVCRAFVFALTQEELTGAFHVVAPNPVTNAVLTQKIAKVLGKPLFAPNVPSFLLKFVLGEMAWLVLGSNRVSTDKFQRADFSYQYSLIEPALQDLLKD